MKKTILILVGIILIGCNDFQKSISTEVNEHCSSVLFDINETLKIFEVRETHDISTIMLVKMRMIHSRSMDRSVILCIKCRDIKLEKESELVETYILLSSQLGDKFFGIDNYDYPLTAKEANDIREIIIKMGEIVREINNLPLLK